MSKDNRYNIENLIGKVFGRLTVVSRAQSRVKPGSRNKEGPRWNCICECGRSTVVQSFNLKKSTKSCGCLRWNPDAAFTKLFGTYTGSARKRGLPWNLKKEQFREITSSPCHYTGRKPSMAVNTAADTYPYNGIDRLDNSKGYTLENCVPCCAEANYAKRALSYADFIKLCEDIAQWQKKKKS